MSRRKLQRYLNSQISNARELRKLNQDRRPQMANLFIGSVQALQDVRDEFVGPFEVAASHSERIEVSPHWHVEGELDSTVRRNIERMMQDNARELRRKQEGEL